MTEPIPATPGWVETELDRLFAGLPATMKPAVDAFAACLARAKQPAAPSDTLGAEFTSCHHSLRRALLQAGIPDEDRTRVGKAAEALEAEIAAQT